MSERQPFSLQAWPAVDKEKDSLPYLISRINEQKGSFRNVTEESLEAELQRLERDGGNDGLATKDDLEAETTIEGDDASSKKESIYKAREDILKQLG